MSQIKYGTRVRPTQDYIDSLVLPGLGLRVGLGLGLGVRVRLTQVYIDSLLSPVLGLGLGVRVRLTQICIDSLLLAGVILCFNPNPNFLFILTQSL